MTIITPDQSISDTINASTDTEFRLQGEFVERVAIKRPSVRIKAKSAIITGSITINASDVVWYNGTLNGDRLLKRVGVVEIAKSVNGSFVCGVMIEPHVESLAWAVRIYGEYCSLIDCVVTAGNNHMLYVEGEGNTFTGNIFEDSKGWDCARIFGEDHVFSFNTYRDISRRAGVQNHVDIWQTFGEAKLPSYGHRFFEETIINCGGQIMQIEAKGQRIGGWEFKDCVWLNQGAQANIDAPGFKFRGCAFIECTRNTGHPLYFVNGTKGVAHNSTVDGCYFINCGKFPGSRDVGWYKYDAGLTGRVTQGNYVGGTVVKRCGEPEGVVNNKATLSDVPLALRERVGL